MKKAPHSQDLSDLLRECTKGNRKSQEELYNKFFGYAMGVCLRYSKDREEAEEILNDGFLKIFSRMNQQRDPGSFKGWVRKTMINSAIDHYRKYQKHYGHTDLVNVKIESPSPNSLHMLTQQDILAMVQKLPPSYRMVFVLHAIEGYKHGEISVKLDISEGTSKSNLAKARAKLRKMLANTDRENFEQYG